MKEDIIRKLTSRKLWLAIVGFVTGLLLYLGHSEAETTQIGALIMAGASVIAYIIGEGLADAAGADAAAYTPEELRAILELDKDKPPEEAE